MEEAQKKKSANLEHCWKTLKTILVVISCLQPRTTNMWPQIKVESSRLLLSQKEVLPSWTLVLPQSSWFFFCFCVYVIYLERLREQKQFSVPFNPTLKLYFNVNSSIELVYECLFLSTNCYLYSLHFCVYQSLFFYINLFIFGRVGSSLLHLGFL